MARSSLKDQLMLPKEAKTVEWLIEMSKRSDPTTSSKPRIGRVPLTLREIDTNKACFDPLVVSLGPYHHDKERLKPMEPHKETAARWFISLLSTDSDLSNHESADDDWDCKVREIYENFVATVTPNPIDTRNNPIEATCNSTLKDWYVPDDTIDKLNDEDLTIMIFLDGCFILYFIDLLVNNPVDLMNKTHLNQPFIVRDMFLLENQVPYVVLKSLMSLIPSQGSNNRSNGKEKKDQSHIIQMKDIEEFILRAFLPNRESLGSSSSRLHGNLFKIIKGMESCFGTDHKTDGSYFMGDREPLHLLDILRIHLIGGPVTLSKDSFNSYYFRSIMELKTGGIKLHRSHSSHLKEIKFKKGIFCAHLSLPQMIVDDATKIWLLNLIAYEMCPERTSDFVCVITSYICFLDSLIDHAEDVKELRSKDILLNRLGNDEEVAKLFNELANNLTPNPKVYADVMKEIESHCKNRFKVWFAEMLHTHFNSPWTVISLIAGIFLLFLTVIQTIFTVWFG